MRPQILLFGLVSFLICATLISCSNDKSQLSPVQTAALQALPQRIIHLNQLGFLPQDNKIALVSGESQGEFKLVDGATQQVHFSATLGQAKLWPMSGEWVSTADFSQVTQAGIYHLKLADGSRSTPFSIADDVYADLHDASLKAYYFNRASMALDQQFAGQWARKLGHPDNKVRVHSSASSVARPAGTIIAAPKGWYDAATMASMWLILGFRLIPCY